MSNNITIVGGIDIKGYSGGKVEYHTPMPGFLENVVKKSIELGMKPAEVKWLSIAQGSHYKKPHPYEQVAIQEIKDGGNVLIDAQAVPAVAERINGSSELLDPASRARVYFWLYHMGNVRNGTPPPPYEGEWINDYNEYVKLLGSKIQGVLELAPYL